jgi:hypothetical protein
MKTSKVLLLSVFITALILVVIGGVTSIAIAKKTTSPSNEEIVQTYQKREEDYNQLIQQANQQLADANAKLQALQTQDNQNKAENPSSTNSTTVNSSTAVSVNKAEEIARKAADPISLLSKGPELVDFEGKTAYEVVFQNGKIYIDSQTGEVLFNGTIPQVITAEKAVQIASNYLKNKNILLVDQITFRRSPTYRVIFKNGMMVYIDTTGQIIYIQKATPKLVDNSSQGSGGSSSAAPSYTENEHEGGDD